MENATEVSQAIESVFVTINAWLHDMQEERRDKVLRAVILTVNKHIGQADDWLIPPEEDDDSPSSFVVSTDSGVPLSIGGEDMPAGHLLCFKSNLQGARLSAIEDFLDPSEGAEEVKLLKRRFMLMMTSIIAGVVEVSDNQVVSFKWPPKSAEQGQPEGETVNLAAIPFVLYAFALCSELGECSDDVAEEITALAERLDYFKAEETSASGGQGAEDMPTLEAIAPTWHVAPNSKVTQVLREGKSALLFEQGGRPLIVDKKNTQIQFALWQDEEAAIEVSDTIDAEDMTVIEAVTTLKHAGNTVITPGQIIRNMGYKSTPELVEEVHGRVLRLMSIKGRIDCTEQLKRWHKTHPDTGEEYDHGELIGNLLSMTVFDGTDVKGNRDIRYKVASDPITYEHARLVHQVIEYPPRLLDLAPVDIDGNEKRRVDRNQKKLERAVLWYVFSLKNPKNRMSNYVTYEALFDYEGVKPGSPSARKRAITFIHDYLRALVNEGVIYTFVPKVERSRRHRQLGVTLFVEKPGKGKRG